MGSCVTVRSARRLPRCHYRSNLGDDVLRINSQRPCSHDDGDSADRCHRSNKAQFLIDLAQFQGEQSHCLCGGDVAQQVAQPRLDDTDSSQAELGDFSVGGRQGPYLSRSKSAARAGLHHRARRSREAAFTNKWDEGACAPASYAATSR
jgi:hypothetical protein